MPTTAATPPGPARVNLLPDAVRYRNAARARRRLWSAAVVSVLLLTGLAFQWTTRAHGEIRSADALLSDVLGQIARQRQRLSDLKQRSALLQEQFTALDSMSRKVSWADRLAIIAQAVPPEMVLSHLSAAAREAERPEQPSSSEDPKQKPARTVQQLRLEGYARRYTDIAEFLRRLRDARLFDHVSLTQSAPQPGGRGELLAFGVSCEK